MRVSLTLIFFFSAVLIMGVTHILALEFYLYFSYPWLDIPLHILGGVCVALGLFSLPKLGIAIPERYLMWIPVLLITLIVGLLWEIFEIKIGIPLIQPEFEADMVSDLIMDLVGGTIGYIVGSRIKDF